MSDTFYETREWKIGDSAQQRWARIVANGGSVVLPTYGMDEVDAATKAPVLFTCDGLLVAPDLLVMSHGQSKWNEVKAKSQPTWRRFSPGPRWEHGCDYSLRLEYERVRDKSGSEVFIVVNEIVSPVDPNADSELMQSDEWLVISLSKAIETGDRRSDWPGGKKNPQRRGRKGMGGWFWARSAMDRVERIECEMAQFKKVGVGWLTKDRKGIRFSVDEDIPSGSKFLVKNNKFKTKSEEDQKKPDYILSLIVEEPEGF